MILDGDGNEQTSAAIRVAPGAEKLFSYFIDCRAGYEVRAVAVADVIISAKAEPGDAFQNIETDPLSLDAFAGQIKTIYFKIAADADAIRRDDLAQIIVALS